MFDVDIIFDDIVISSMQGKDLITAQRWIEYQVQYNDYQKQNYVGLFELYERFLESYVSENEFFLKINKKDELVGILKGRLEFKNPNEVWFWYFLMDNSLSKDGVDKKIINIIIKYFKVNFGIKSFFVGIEENDEKMIKFWESIDYNIIRVSKDFFNIDGRNIDMLILKKEG